MRATKVIFAAVLMLCMMIFSNFGYCAKSPEYSADKAILAYAEVYAFGETDNASCISLSDEDMTEIKGQLRANFAEEFKEFCLSEESINKLTDVYIGKLQAEMNIQTKIKSRNKKAPVVTVTANILNHENFGAPNWFY